MTLYAFGIDNGLYLMQAVPFAIIVYVLFRFVLKVSTWHLNDLLFVLLPGTAYWAVDESFHAGKTLSNAVAEPFLVAICCGLLFLIRALTGKYRPSRVNLVMRANLLFVLIIPLLVYFLTPSLPE